jgi:hypothetical protein
MLPPFFFISGLHEIQIPAQIGGLEITLALHLKFPHKFLFFKVKFRPKRPFLVLPNWHGGQKF